MNDWDQEVFYRRCVIVAFFHSCYLSKEAMILSDQVIVFIKKQMWKKFRQICVGDTDRPSFLIGLLTHNSILVIDYIHAAGFDMISWIVP